MDEELSLTLKRIHDSLHEGGRLIVRAAVPPLKNGYSMLWRLETFKMKIRGIQPHYRSRDRIHEMMTGAGFEIDLVALSGSNDESVWFIAKS